MKPLLNDLWNGQIHPFEECARLDERLRQLSARTEACRNVLTESLTPAQITAMEKWEEAMYDMMNYNMEKSFVKGLEFTSQFFMEVLG